MSLAVSVHNLTKTYGAFPAVKGIDFDIHGGEVFGLLGPNGAGKTTTVEILEGLREIKRGDYGRVITIPSTTSIREKTGLSQARFAQLLGVSVRTLQDWEQGRRAPSGAARTLLMVAAKNPRALLEVA